MTSRHSVASARPALLLAPALLVIGVLFAGGIGLALVQSLGYLPALGMRTVSAGAFVTVLTSRGFLRSLGLTLWVAAVSTVLTVLFGLITALVLRRRLRNSRLIRFLYQIPLTVPHLVVAVAAAMLLSQSGLLSRLLFHGGFISAPAAFPELVHDSAGVSIILVYAWKQIPFVGLVALAVLQSVGDDYESVARSLGASRLQRVRHVLVPLTLPAVVPATIIVFAFVFGAFETPLVLGTRFPSMLSVLAYRLYTDTDLTRRPEAMALNLVIALIALVLVALYRVATRVFSERRDG
ncbi:MAG: ABC transporter permease subunit [Spirochaetaceae bacterium]|nr:MAG: ABC transporter permease subunit [Spirochaetaceae bacterium]